MEKIYKNYKYYFLPIYATEAAWGPSKPLRGQRSWTVLGIFFYIQLNKSHCWFYT